MGNELNAYPILLAGGSGTRMWPVSREFFPKQLVRFFGNHSLIQETITRLFPVFDPDHLRVVCGDLHAQSIAEAMDAMGIASEHKIITEPCGRNTAPAILLASLSILAHDPNPDAIVFIFPADHVIGDIDQFQTQVRHALALARENVIVTFGIQPNYPETGYGYIEADQTPIGPGFRLRRFVEKPDLETARKYVASGRYYWNSGMFTFKVSVILEEFETFKPEMLATMRQVLSAGDPIDSDAYSRVESTSIDYAVMEHTQRAVVLPSDFGWSDIGSWKALYDFMEKNENGNVIPMGDVVTRNTKDSFILAQDRLVATNGLKNIVIVETPDAVFVSDMETSRDVRHIVDMLKSENYPQYQTHILHHYPWGYRKTLDSTQWTEVIQIVIYPNAEMPGHFAKPGSQWFITDGQGRLIANGQNQDLQAAQSCQIPATGIEMIRNTGSGELRLVEVWHKQ